MSTTTDSRSHGGPERNTAAGIVTILLALSGWTAIPLFLKHFSHDIDGWTANGWRYGFSALLWLPVLVLQWSKGTTPKGLWKAAWPASVFNIFAQVCFGLAPYYIDPGLMTFSLRLQVIFLMFGAAMLFPSERKVIRTPLFIAGISLLLAGTLLTLWFKEGGLGEAKSSIGVALAISSGVLYAGYGICVRKYMSGLPPFTAFAAVSQYTGVALVLAMFMFGDKSGLLTPAIEAVQKSGQAVPKEWLLGGASVFELGGMQIFLLLLSAFIGIGFGHTCYYYAIQRLGLAVATGVVQLQPVTVSLISMFLFQEKISVLQWCTGTGAICGAVLMLWAQQKVAAKAKEIAAAAANT